MAYCNGVRRFAGKRLGKGADANLRKVARRRSCDPMNGRTLARMDGFFRGGRHQHEGPDESADGTAETEMLEYLATTQVSSPKGIRARCTRASAIHRLAVVSKILSCTMVKPSQALRRR